MSCGTQWDREFLFNNTTQKLISVIKKNREKYIVELEKAKLPETQTYLVYDDEIAQDKLKVIHIDEDIEQISYELRNTFTRKARSALLLQWRTKRDERANLQRKIFHWRKFYRVYNQTERKTIKETKVPHVCPCPTDNCKGFIMKNPNTHENFYKCGTCVTKICRECHETLNDNESHTCDEDNKKSVEHLKKNGKPCPRCGVNIQKISGCDQMWCTQCQTGFSWTRGTIVNGPIHNPHFFEYFRNNPNDQNRANEIRNHHCEGMPDRFAIYRHMDAIFNQRVCPELDYNYYRGYFGLIHRMSVHIEHFELPMIRVLNQNELEEQHLDLRVKYLKNEIDDKHFKMMLFKREKEQETRLKKTQIYEMYITIMNDMLHRFLHSPDAIKALEIKKEIEKVIEYTNKCFENASRVYGYLYMPHIETYYEHGYHSFRMKNGWMNTKKACCKSKMNVSANTIVIE
jgi:hypothetical protein